MPQLDVSETKINRSQYLLCWSTDPSCPTLFSTLDLSFNNIRHVPNLPSQHHISTLYLVQNKIAEVEAGELDWAAKSMKSLELGGNRLRVSETRQLTNHPSANDRLVIHVEN
jgi:Leucine-rich repeat (LRR) protein